MSSLMTYLWTITIYLIIEIKAGSLYNGQPPYGLRGFIGDNTNRIIGYAVFRQVRVKRNSCQVHPSVYEMTQECSQGSAIINEDHNDYCDGWEEKNVLTENLPSCFKNEFKYSTASELNSLPYSGVVWSISLLNPGINRKQIHNII